MITEIYSILSGYFPLYLRVISFALILISLFGYIRPLAAHDRWVKWVSCRFFRFYGLLLAVGTLPLLHFRETISGKILFVVGIITMISAPFIFLFPELFVQVFDENENEMTSEEKKALIYADSSIRLLVAFLMFFVSLN